MHPKFDLEERTLKFGKKIVNFCKTLPPDKVNFRLVDQLIRSGTSIGANYREANETESPKDFKHKILICLRESKETVFWLELIKEANQNFESDIAVLIGESKEYVKIFATIFAKFN